MAIAIQFEQVKKEFSGSGCPAVDDISLSIEEGELITIVGTSGCGKTTLLKMVNRICEPSSGRILLFGEDIKNKDAVKLRQGIGYVIQQIGLFPHLNIFHNIATVPKILKWDKQRIAKRVDELLTLVNLDPEEFKHRFPVQLSGGQQQRVGLARALAAEPDIMLLDEPFGAIDAINRTNLQDELLRIHRKYQKTFLFVTHDMGEAFKLGSRVLIMHQGSVQQFDTPERIVSAPANEFVESLILSSGVKNTLAYSGEGK